MKVMILIPSKEIEISMNYAIGENLMEAAKPIYINSTVQDAAVRLGAEFYNCVRRLEKDYSEIILLCIGTDRATGDSLGPLTGHKLMELLGIGGRIKLYGTLDKPVHAANLQATLKKINKTHNKPLIVAIDACLGKTAHIGYLTITAGGVTPGAGVRRSLPKVGDVAITGIVNFSGVMDLMILQNTRLNVVMRMADVISGGIFTGLKMISSEL